MLSAEIERLARRVRSERRKASSAALAPWIRPVAAALWEGARPGKRYWTDCYRRASDYVLARARQPGPCLPADGVLLVHGVCRDDHVMWAHAWVELPDGVVFDGVRQQFYDRDGYYRTLRATAEATYDAAAMREQMRARRHYGPWHDGRLAHDSVRRLQRLDPTVLAAPGANAGMAEIAGDRRG
jgi:hypothetical protein